MPFYATTNLLSPVPEDPVSQHTDEVEDWFYRTKKGAPWAFEEEGCEQNDDKQYELQTVTYYLKEGREDLVIDLRRMSE